MKVILDASAIIAGFQFDDDNEYFMTGEVLDEIEDKDALLRAEVAEKEGRIRIAKPKGSSVETIKKRLQKLGEEHTLSDADIMTLSLALEIKEKGEDVILATDDYGIQNVARSLSIKYATITERGIKKVLAWHYICTGCGQAYDKNIFFCEICGSKVKRRVKR